MYGEEGKYPSYVKKAFHYANDMLNYYNLRSKVKLFYNDYNTYLISDDIVTMIKFVNQNGKICDGVGMQSHLDVHWPDANYIGNTIDKFKNAGFDPDHRTRRDDQCDAEQIHIAGSGKLLLQHYQNAQTKEAGRCQYHRCYVLGTERSGVLESKWPATVVLTARCEESSL